MDNITIEFDVWDEIPRDVLDLDERLQSIVTHVMGEEMRIYTVGEVHKQMRKFGLIKRGEDSALWNSITWDFSINPAPGGFGITGVLYAEPSARNTQAKINSIEDGRSPGMPPPPAYGDDDILSWVHEVLGPLIRKDKQRKSAKRRAAAVKSGANVYPYGHKAKRKPTFSDADGAKLEEEQVAFLIARDIGIEGISPKPIFGGAFYHIERGISGRFTDALQDL